MTSDPTNPNRQSIAKVQNSLHTALTRACDGAQLAAGGEYESDLGFSKLGEKEYADALDDAKLGASGALELAEDSMVWLPERIALHERTPVTIEYMMRFAPAEGGAAAFGSGSGAFSRTMKQYENRHSDALTWHVEAGAPHALASTCHVSASQCLFSYLSLIHI